MRCRGVPTNGLEGRRRPGRTGALLLVVCAALVLAGCAQVPDAGPVVEVKERAQPPTDQGQYNHPKGPQPGDTRKDIVAGFLVAMTATPLETRTAQEFLSRQAQQQWQPQQRVVTYRDHSQPHGTDRVVVRLRGADQVGSRGQWQGSVAAADRRLTFPMTREGGQWRIAQVPNALIVPRTFYDQQYQEAEVYFFDPSGRILVPEPVHVPQGTQLASNLVSKLVRGPSRSLTGVTHSFLPPGLSPGPVPISVDGIADVTLNGQDPGPISRKTTRLIIEQLSWTLRQDPAITGFRLTIAGHQVIDPAGAGGAKIFRFNLDEADPHDPAGSRASSYYYALRAGRLVSGQITRPTKVEGPFGDQRLGIRSFAVSLNGEEVAGVTSDALLVGPVSQPGPAIRVLSGPGLLRPAWDLGHRLWEVQVGAGGATVSYVTKDQAHPVPVPGITGKNVTRFLVSRDGSRLVAVLRGPAGDRIVVSRLRYDSDDHPQRGTRARPIPWLSSGTQRIRDIGWSSPTTLEVLDQLSAHQAEARILNVDGSTAADETPTTTIPGLAIGLATSPVGGTQTPYAVLAGTRSARRSLYDLAQVDTTPASVASIATPRLRHITYAG